ncbi:MAG: hypothetical protein WCY77_10270 [Weeksellaceae bacterium]
MKQFEKSQIENWKKTHGEIFQLNIDGKIAILRKPDRKTLSYATSVASKDPMKFNEIMLAGCWLGGDEEIKTDDSLFLAAASKIAELIEIKEAELVKL